MQAALATLPADILPADIVAPRRRRRAHARRCAWRFRDQHRVAAGQAGAPQSAAAGAGDPRRAARERADRARPRSPGPASSTSICRRRRTSRSCRASSISARRTATASAARAEHGRRVRLGQSHRAAARRPRPAGGARRCARRAAAVAGLPGQPRVLLQRRRRADPESRAVGAGARARHQARRAGLAGGRVQRRVHPGHRRRLPREEDRARVRRRAGQGQRQGRRPGRRSAASRSRTCATSRTSTCRSSACASTSTTWSRASTATARSTRPCKALVASGKTYEKDGALWLRTTDYGDDKDRVMRKSDGTYTYFVPDVAYHVTKWQRGFRARSTCRAPIITARSRACAPACRR